MTLKDNQVNYVIHQPNIPRDPVATPLTKFELEKALEKLEDDTTKSSLMQRLQKLKNMESNFFSLPFTPTFKVMVLIDFTMRETGFLSLLHGDIVRVIDNSNPIWWYGDINGKLGYFPSHIVYGGSLKLDPSPFESPLKSESLGEIAAVITITNYVGNSDSELSFKKGTIIFLIDSDPKEDWWEGVIDKRIGYFHKACVVPIEPKKLGDLTFIRDRPKTTSFEGVPIFDKEKLALVMYNFSANGKNELSLMKGTVVTILDGNHDEDWWEGSVGRNTGYFPRTYVELLGATENSKTKLKEAQVLYDFTAVGPTELSLKRGDQVFVLEQDCNPAEEWWEGHVMDGSYGFFPKNFIQFTKTKEEIVPRIKSLSLNREALGPSLTSLQINPVQQSSPSRKKRFSRGKPTRKESLQIRLEEDIKSPTVLRKMSVLVDRMSLDTTSKPHSDDKNVKFQRLEVELNNEKLRNHHLATELKELEKTLGEENSGLKKEIARMKAEEEFKKKDTHHLAMVAAALRDAEELMELQQRRTTVLKQLHEVYLNEISETKKQLVGIRMTHNKATETFDNNPAATDHAAESGTNNTNSSSTNNTVCSRDNNNPLQVLVAQLQEELGKEIKRGEDLQRQVMEANASLQVAEIQLEERNKRFAATENELASLSSLYKALSEESKDRELKLISAESRYTQLVLSGEKKQQYELDIENWKAKCLYLEDKLENKHNKNVLLKDKCQQLELWKTSLEHGGEALAKGEETLTKRDETLTKKDDPPVKGGTKGGETTTKGGGGKVVENPAKGGGKVGDAPHKGGEDGSKGNSQPQIDQPKNTLKEDPKTTKKKEKHKEKDEKKPDEEVDEETHNSFRRAQMFFAARAVTSPVPKPEPIIEKSKAEKKQKH